MKTRIKNINPKYGEPVEFAGDDLLDCIHAMATAVWKCGAEVRGGRGVTVNDLCFRLRCDEDYEVLAE